MNPIEAVTSVFRNYVNFNGRAQRSEFWWFVLFSFISQAILNFVPVLGPIYALALLLPSLAVTARRLHDTNRTAWWMLLYLIPVLGFIVLLIVALVLLGTNAFDPWQAGEVEWGVIGILFLIWLLVSIASWIVLLVFQILPGTPGPNRYGPDPLQPSGVAAPGFGAAGHGYEPSTPTAGFGGFDPGAQPSPHPDLPQAGQPQPASERQRRYCTQCGTPLAQDARFCTYCGTAI